MTDPDRRPRPRASDGAFEPLPEGVGPGTTAVHGARRRDLNAGSLVPPIHQTATFHYPAEFSDAAPEGQLYLYTRHENPTQQVAQELVRQLEGSESARVFASGMGAISAALLSLTAGGDEVVALSTLYGGTLDLLRNLLPRGGVRVRWVDEREASDPERVLSPSTRVVVLESPTNPTLRVHDLARWARAARSVGAVTLVDNTMATPVNQRPISLGIDLVAHSATKSLGGHSDLIAGVLAGPRALLERIDATRIVLGATLDPLAAFLLQRGLRTLALRVERQNLSGRAVAEDLREHPKVASVCYPGFASEEEEAIARRQMRGRGGMVGVTIKGGSAATRRFLGALRLVQVAASLGGVESLVSVPAETSHVHLTPDELRALGIEEGFVRLSLGIEETEDLLADLHRALDAV